MVKLEKIVCFIFTLFIVYLVNKQCLVEGVINLNSFTNCIDDPQWYSLDRNGNKNYCKDIGTSASCYDMDPLQQEGWERCLKTCGNCVDTTVSIAPMDNSALYSGGTGEDFDRVNIDDSRKWLGLGVGDEDTMDVRESLTRDEEDDIVNIFERLETVEDLYDMLLSSVSSCIDCSQFNENECINTSYCKFENSTCITNDTEENSGSFISCKGPELSCEYTVKESNIDGPPDSSDDSLDNSSVNEVDSDSVTHTYVKHYCDDDGVCSLLFPTYDINCNALPEKRDTMENYPSITYEPRPIVPLICLSDEYYSIDDGNNVTPLVSPVGHECRNNISNIEPRNISLTDNSKINIDTEIWEDYQDVNFSPKDTDTSTNSVQTDICNSFSSSKVKVNNDNTISLLTVNEIPSIDNIVQKCNISRSPSNDIDEILPRNMTISENSNIIIEENENWINNQSVELSLKEGLSGTDCDIDNVIVRVNDNNTLSMLQYQELDNINRLEQNCQISRVGGRIGDIKNKCYLLDESQIDVDDTMKEKKECALYCNTVSPINNYITVNEQECRCFSNLPSNNEYIVQPSDNNCPTENPVPFLDEGRAISMERLRMTNTNDDDNIRNMCKNYFLLETSLENDEDSDNSISGINGMTDRISLYDVCPRQCKAIGCE